MDIKKFSLLQEVPVIQTGDSQPPQPLLGIEVHKDQPLSPEAEEFIRTTNEQLLASLKAGDYSRANQTALGGSFPIHGPSLRKACGCPECTYDGNPNADADDDLKRDTGNRLTIADGDKEILSGLGRVFSEHQAAAVVLSSTSPEEQIVACLLRQKWMRIDNVCCNVRIQFGAVGKEGISKLCTFERGNINSLLAACLEAEASIDYKGNK